MAACHSTGACGVDASGRYADTLCRHPMPTGLTHGPPIGRESLPKGYADKGMPTTYAGNLCRQPMPTSVDSTSPGRQT